MRLKILHQDLNIDKILESLEGATITLAVGPPLRSFVEELIRENPEVLDFLDIESPVSEIDGDLLISEGSPASYDQFVATDDDLIHGRTVLNVDRMVDAQGRVTVDTDVVAGSPLRASDVARRAEEQSTRLPVKEVPNERETNRMTNTSRNVRRIMNDLESSLSPGRLNDILKGKTARSIYGDGTVLGTIGEGVSVARAFLEDGVATLNNFFENPFGLMRRTTTFGGPREDEPPDLSGLDFFSPVMAPVGRQADPSISPLNMDLPRESIAYIAVVEEHGEQQETFRTYRFFLQSVQEPSQETFQMFTTFDTHIPFFFNRRPNIYTYSGDLLDAFEENPREEDSTNHQWKLEMEHTYFNKFRGTAAIQNQTLVQIVHSGLIRTGYMINYTRSSNANRMGIASFRFDFLVLNEQTYYGVAFPTVMKPEVERGPFELEEVEVIQRAIQAVNETPGKGAFSEASGSASPSPGINQPPNAPDPQFDNSSRDRFPGEPSPGLPDYGRTMIA